MQHDTALRADMDSCFQGIRNDMTYFANAMRFVDAQFGTLFTKFVILGPDPTTIARPLPSVGPPFPARDPTVVPPPNPGVAGIDPEEVAHEDDDDDVDAMMAEGDAKESSSDEDDAEEEEAAESSSEDDAAGDE